MRLTCPNCGARYEVADDVIPPAGRDVQCSNCDHVWLQEAAGVQDPEAVSDSDRQPGEAAGGTAGQDGGSPDHAPPEQPSDSDDASASARHPGWGADEILMHPRSRDEPDPEPGHADEPDRHGGLEAGPGRRLDPRVEEILRTEAERERTAREAERLESQGELGLDALGVPPPGPAAAGREPATVPRRPRSARADGPSGAADRRTRDDEAAGVPATAPARRDRLPDVEQITSAFDTGRGDASDAAALRAEANRARGFRLGFGLITLVAAGLTFLYLGAEEIGTALPAAAPALTAYEAAVDEGRLWLDIRVQELMAGAE